MSTPSNVFQSTALKIIRATGFGQLAKRSDRADRTAAQHQLSSEGQRTAFAARSKIDILDGFHILDMSKT
jgi:hypothetical protein